MPGSADERPRPIPDVRGIEVTTASPRYLLADLYPQSEPPPRTRFFLEELLGPTIA
jgi:hypothetical protein